MYEDLVKLNWQRHISVPCCLLFQRLKKMFLYPRFHCSFYFKSSNRLFHFAHKTLMTGFIESVKWFSAKNSTYRWRSFFTLERYLIVMEMTSYYLCCWPLKLNRIAFLHTRPEVWIDPSGFLYLFKPKLLKAIVTYTTSYSWNSV